MLLFTSNYIIFNFYISANDLVRRMFTLQFQQRKKITSIKMMKYQDLVKRHEFDYLSPEALSM